ncbi:hypothetical protein ZHAS_00004025 [Anopheles sinensis]|uniref:Uncharacterized protein n=1 Tax=Anopheles sinensis TaxID=74873 RepID=A0A084VFV7_ANOSI|nr:hypothetical protein ZHAS_00004025 [Anopheles sinensis]
MAFCHSAWPAPGFQRKSPNQPKENSKGAVLPHALVELANLTHRCGPVRKLRYDDSNIGGCRGFCPSVLNHHRSISKVEGLTGDACGIRW